MRDRQKKPPASNDAGGFFALFANENRLVFRRGGRGRGGRSERGAFFRGLDLRLLLRCQQSQNLRFSVFFDFFEFSRF